MAVGTMADVIVDKENISMTRRFDKEGNLIISLVEHESLPPLPIDEEGNIIISEHDRLPEDKAVRCKNYDELKLIRWQKSKDCDGYYAYDRIGAEWIDGSRALIVTPKLKHIDFLGMFMTCFMSDLSLDSLDGIYDIDFDRPQISSPHLNSVVSPLIVIHFISVVNRIKSLKRGYVHHQENLRHIKGRVKLLENEKLNIIPKRYERLFCEYDEYSVDIPENRLIKKALSFSQVLMDRILRNHKGSSKQWYPKMKSLIAKSLKKFENVSDEVEIKAIGPIRSNRLFNEYSEAIRLAKTILRHFDYSINEAGSSSDTVPPFWLNMALLFEHYVYGLLHEAYDGKIEYQFDSKETGRPDFLYISDSFKSDSFKAILDTKYIPKYDEDSFDKDVIRQLGGYSRDLKILQELGYKDIEEESPNPPVVPCVIIYPKEGDDKSNPFKDKDLKKLCTIYENLLMFYKIGITIPTLKTD